MILAAFQDYLPLSDFFKILIASAIAAVIAPCGMALVITGLGAQAAANARGDGTSAIAVMRIVVGVAALVGLIAVGIIALVDK